jgi:hypothetical protein
VNFLSLATFVIHSDDNKKFRIIGGNAKIFDILRENDHLVEVEVAGCVFLGDFIYAGVKNIQNETAEAERMDKLVKRIKHLNTLLDNNTDLVGHTFIDELFDINNLEDLCSLQITIEPKDKTIRIPQNEMNFFGCFPNGPT